jgi:hypothetical protein
VSRLWRFELGPPLRAREIATRRCRAYGAGARAALKITQGRNVFQTRHAEWPPANAWPSHTVEGGRMRCLMDGDDVTIFVVVEIP